MLKQNIFCLILLPPHSLPSWISPVFPLPSWLLFCFCVTSVLRAAKSSINRGNSNSERQKLDGFLAYADPTLQFTYKCTGL